MKREKKIMLGLFAIFIISMTGLLYVIGQISIQKPVSHSGTISAVNLTVSSAQDGVAITSLFWGAVNPGAVKTQIIWIKNTGNVAISTDMNNGYQSPAVLSVEWNGGGQIIQSGASMSATITLVLKSEVGSETTFSFNTTIIGTQV